MLKLRLDAGDLVTLGADAILKIDVIGGQAGCIEVNTRSGDGVIHSMSGGRDAEIDVLPMSVSVCPGDSLLIGESRVDVFSNTDHTMELRIEAPQDVRIVAIKSDSTKQWRNARRAKAA